MKAIIKPDTNRPASKFLSLFLVVMLLAGSFTSAIIIVDRSPAFAAENGPGYYDAAPGYPFLGAYKTSGGNFVYCTEHLAPPPYANLPASEKVTSLPAATFDNPLYGKGTVKALTSTKKMRQLNYLLDVHGRNPNNLTAAGLEVAIWIMRDDKFVADLKKSLKSTADGKKILAKAEALLTEAETNAVAPKEAPEMKGKLKIDVTENKKSGTVTFPAGTTTLQLSKGNIFKSSGSETVQLTAAQTKNGGTRSFTTKDANPKKEYEIKVTGKWKFEGSKGWAAELIQHVNKVPREQAVVRAVGPTTPKAKSGNFDASTSVAPNKEIPKEPTVKTKALATAELGGTMTDTAIIAGSLDSEKSYEIDFIAYLKPIAGEPKYDTNWNIISGQKWGRDELAAMSTAKQCVAQPVATTAKQKVTKTGNHVSPKVTVKSHGTIHWVERFYENGKVKITGECGLANETTQIEPKPVKIRTEAMASAEVGGFMTDDAIVTGDVMPNSEISFTAYLVPVVGSTKYDSNWQIIYGDEYQHQKEDPETGLPLFESWWANENGDSLLDDDDEPISTEISSGTAADGTEFPVPTMLITDKPVMVIKTDGEGEPIQLKDEEGNLIFNEEGNPEYDVRQAVDDDGNFVFEQVAEAVLDYEGNPLYQIVKTPVMENRRDPLVWDAAELQGLSTAEKAALQPIATTAVVPVTKAGTVRSPEVAVKSAGVIYWSEKFTVDGATKHTGKIGLANEKTIIDAPAVRTQALAEANYGDEIYDIATVSGKLSDAAEYFLKFEAFKAEFDEQGRAVCLPENEIFQSKKYPVTRLGQIQSDSFIVRYEHGQTIWWVETLSEKRDAEEIVIHTGDCGVANETTSIIEPRVAIKATEEAAVGDTMTDIAIVTGSFNVNNNANYEVTFNGYAEAWQGADETIRLGNKFDENDSPYCGVSNLLFQTGGTAVSGPGEYESEPVSVSHLYRTDQIWWSENLWLIEGERRTLLHTGECGLENETTEILRPEVTTQAVDRAVPGDQIFDIAYVGGFLASSEEVNYELTFDVYKEHWLPTENATATDDSNDIQETTDIAETDIDSLPEEESGREKYLEDGFVPVCDPQVNLVTQTAAVPVTGTGEYVSEKVTVTSEHEGNLWWVETLWQINGEELIPVAEGICGLLNETTEVISPRVTTKAVDKAFIGDEYFDTAIVEGELTLREGTKHHLIFEAYEAVTNVTGDAVCEPENLLFETKPVAVTGAGEYESEKRVATLADVGTIWWVESLYLTEEGEENILLHRGDCGLTDETTVIQSPKVTTLAIESVVAGEEIYDTAFVTAPLSTKESVMHQLKFTAYLQPNNTKEPMCEQETEIFSGEIEIENPGEYQSPRFVTTLDHIGTVFWVEELYAHDGDKKHLIAKGECGLPNETTLVKSPEKPEKPVDKPDEPTKTPKEAELPETGAGSITAPLITGIVLMLAGATVVLFRRSKSIL